MLLNNNKYLSFQLGGLHGWWRNYPHSVLRALVLLFRLPGRLLEMSRLLLSMAPDNLRPRDLGFYLMAAVSSLAGCLGSSLFYGLAGLAGLAGFLREVSPQELLEEDLEIMAWEGDDLAGDDLAGDGMTGEMDPAQRAANQAQREQYAQDCLARVEIQDKAAAALTQAHLAFMGQFAAINRRISHSFRLLSINEVVSGQQQDVIVF